MNNEEGNLNAPDALIPISPNPSLDSAGSNEAPQPNIPPRIENQIYNQFLIQVESDHTGDFLFDIYRFNIQIESDRFDQLFDVINIRIWIHIARFADSDVLEVLATIPELNNIHHFITAEIDSDYAYARYMDTYFATAYSELRLSVDLDETFLYGWGAEAAHFASETAFYRFCQCSGILPHSMIIQDQNAEDRGVLEDPTDALDLSMHNLEPPNLLYRFFSQDRQLVFECTEDPRRVHIFNSFGMVGRRERSRRMESWFREHGIFSAITHGGRTS